MSEPFQQWCSEPESVEYPINLQGQGAAAPTRLNVGARFSVARTGVGVIVISFNDDPGPTFQGVGGFCFGDATAANVLGWSIAAGAYVARSGSTPAKFTFTIGNAANAAADLPATSTLSLDVFFKQAPAVE